MKQFSGMPASAAFKIWTKQEMKRLGEHVTPGKWDIQQFWQFATEESKRRAKGDMMAMMRLQVYDDPSAFEPHQLQIMRQDETILLQKSLGEVAPGEDTGNGLYN
jgi:hypothetical protein